MTKKVTFRDRLRFIKSVTQQTLDALDEADRKNEEELQRKRSIKNWRVGRAVEGV